MEWLFLALAVLFESFAIIMMKVTPAFKSMSFGAIILAFFIISFYLESLAIKKIDLTLAYSVWVGSGIIFIALVDFFYLNSEITHIGILSLIGIVICLVIFAIFGYK